MRLCFLKAGSSRQRAQSQADFTSAWLGSAAEGAGAGEEPNGDIAAWKAVLL